MPRIKEPKRRQYDLREVTVLLNYPTAELIKLKAREWGITESELIKQGIKMRLGIDDGSGGGSEGAAQGAGAIDPVVEGGEGREPAFATQVGNG